MGPVLDAVWKVVLCCCTAITVSISRGHVANVSLPDELRGDHHLVVIVAWPGHVIPLLQGLFVWLDPWHDRLHCCLRSFLWHHAQATKCPHWEHDTPDCVDGDLRIPRVGGPACADGDPRIPEVGGPVRIDGDPRIPEVGGWLCVKMFRQRLLVMG